MSQDTGRAHPSDRATRASPEPASGLGQKASVPCAFTLLIRNTIHECAPDHSVETISVGALREAAATIQELHDALAELLAYASKVGGGILWHVSDQECAKKARAALAKARGQ